MIISWLLDFSHSYVTMVTGFYPQLFTITIVSRDTLV